MTLDHPFVLFIEIGDQLIEYGLLVFVRPTPEIDDRRFIGRNDVARIVELNVVAARSAPREEGQGKRCRQRGRQRSFIPFAHSFSPLWIFLYLHFDFNIFQGACKHIILPKRCTISAFV